MLNLFVIAWITYTCGLLLMWWTPSLLWDRPLMLAGVAAAAGGVVNLVAPAIWPRGIASSRQLMFSDRHSRRAARFGRWAGLVLGVIGLLLTEAW
ncbi:hypothetical protein WK66_05700 [Burkholderia ubonensis]|nr:hypothetical protein WK66_05700 [Burkholderia ubonensis]